MLKFIKDKKLNFVFSTILSVVLHMLLVFFLCYSFSIKNTNNISELTDKKLVSTDIKLTNQSTKMVKQPSVLSVTQERKLQILPDTKKITNNNNKNYESDLNYLLNKLINNKSILNPNKLQIQFTDDTGFYQQEYQSTLDAMNLYKIMITQSITDKFYNNIHFSGKKCTLHITLDDTINIIKSFEGDFELCQAAISAVRLAKLPEPPNSEIYEMFKNITLNFAPQ